MEVANIEEIPVETVLAHVDDQDPLKKFIPGKRTASNFWHEHVYRF
jgi:hypothetical protein